MFKYGRSCYILCWVMLAVFVIIYWCYFILNASLLIFRCVWCYWVFFPLFAIGIDTKIEVIVVSPTTWEAHHSPRAKPEGCGELPRSLVTPQWPKSRYQFRFYHDAPKHIKFMQIRVCISRKSLIKLLQISHHGKHGHRPLSQQLP